ncbi:Sulfotransferase domain protein [Botrimarina colliarenosi]|uniref:Sulfotransferase domain protein n=1 Tax=Botrimarina colliarenosi TaxID=2528001 RepID=A0A5C6AFY2_9BACT|nr:sulfotransferase domain-containing protein [Botrimarina colliarenosi]TWT97971.1 Sulfotransferase domain protein [Botrimarina colliarenosi]
MPRLLSSLQCAAARMPMPPGVKASLRHVMQRIGCYDYRLPALGIGPLAADYAFVASYPKSGNTWMRFLLAHLASSSGTVSFRNLDTLVRDLHKPGELPRPIGANRVFKTHFPFFDLYPTCIYLVRDPRDVAISYYHYEADRGRWQGSRRDFIATADHTFGSWRGHVEGAVAASRLNPRFKIFRYEDMLTDCAAVVSQTAELLSLECTAEQIDAAIEACRFENLKQVEQRHGGEQNEKDATFFREGKSRQWESTLTDEEVTLIEQQSGELMQRFGYN